MKIKLELWGKNWALLNRGEPYIIEAENVPRVGEIIDIGQDFEADWGSPSTFIVCDVIWENEENKLIPNLKCHRWFEGDRLTELEAHGWVTSL